MSKNIRLAIKTARLQEKEILTVKELISLLKKCPQNYKVIHEGCDCYGKANGVEIDNEEKTILITRS